MAGLEDRVAEVEGEVFDQVAGLVVLVQQLKAKQISSGSIEAASDDGSNRHVLPRNGTSQLHPDLERYLDKTGDVGLLGEQLVNLDVDFEEATAMRAFDAEHDRPPSTSDSEFLRRHHDARELLERKLGPAIEVADELKAICLAIGLNIDLGANAFSEANGDDQSGHSEASVYRNSTLGGYVGSSIASYRALRSDLLSRDSTFQATLTGLCNDGSSMVTFNGQTTEMAKRVVEWTETLSEASTDPPSQSSLPPCNEDLAPSSNTLDVVDVSERKLRDVSDGSFVCINESRPHCDTAPGVRGQGLHQP
ncbi:hypothetical protein LTR36_003908 [Oleoguttula mirabilis]|uniref:Uncharacterized protein n=1 Tax=Oleoguttula mirabilis TaxID=1507867 RepID=A0AAV9JHE8_9PEZI|nr:hypothetical protein LTR36_003908 [Oleoguttula mirabilis]